MSFTLLDWSAIVGYLAITLVLGLWFRRRSGKSVDDYFVSGRNVNWWLAGTSMVATTFAADTPLVVTGLVYSQGISGNWLWWGFLFSGMMTVFLFARLWRRSGLLTDVQFAEIRYSGKPAAFLRGFRAIYLGLLMNCVILGWVTKAMTSIVGTTLANTPMLHNISNFMSPLRLRLERQRRRGSCHLCSVPHPLHRPLRRARRPMGRALDRPLPVRAQDGHRHRRGLLRHQGLRRHERADRQRAADAGPRGRQCREPAELSAQLLARRDLRAHVDGPLANFFVFIGLQWWAFWYPGAEPGGGGYIAQRIFSARDEKQGLLSVLWFNIAHYAIRPWPWILTGICVIVLYPGLAHPETGYMLVLNTYLPHQYRGIAIAGFLAAFMSTIATQLNWGASYLVSDFYRRFVNKNATESHYVMVSRLCTVLLVIVAAWVSVQLGSIASGWEIVLQVGAGTGAVYILRWYWWRINAWSEISAMACSLLISLVLSHWHFFSGNSSLVFAKGAIVTTIVTTLVWVTVTLLTKPEPQEVLTRFYRNVRPDVRGWQRIADLEPSVTQNRDLGRNLWAWALGCAMVYLALFGTGKILLNQSGLGAILLFFSALCAGLLYRGVIRNFADEVEDAPGTVPDWVEKPVTSGH